MVARETAPAEVRPARRAGRFVKRLVTVVVGVASVTGLAYPLRAADVAAAPVEDKVKDVLTTVNPADIQIGGVLGERMKVNLEQRLLKVDEHALVDGFVHRPGSHPWIGEHAG